MLGRILCWRWLFVSSFVYTFVEQPRIEGSERRKGWERGATIWQTVLWNIHCASVKNKRSSGALWASSGAMALFLGCWRARKRALAFGCEEKKGRRFLWKKLDKIPSCFCNININIYLLAAATYWDRTTGRATEAVSIHSRILLGFSGKFFCYLITACRIINSTRFYIMYCCA